MFKLCQRVQWFILIIFAIKCVYQICSCEGMSFLKIFMTVLIGITKGFSGGSVVNNLPASARDVRLIPSLGRSPGEGNGSPLQYSCLGNPMGREDWRGVVPGNKSQDSDLTQ